MNVAQPPRSVNRAKFGEQAFLDIYQKLYEAPDPAPMLALGLVRFPSLKPREFELNAFRQELDNIAPIASRTYMLQACLY